MHCTWLRVAQSKAMREVELKTPKGFLPPQEVFDVIYFTDD